MPRRTLAIALLAGMVTASLSGCVFLPNLLGDDRPDDSEITETDDQNNDDSDPDDSEFPDVDLVPSPPDDDRDDNDDQTDDDNNDDNNADSGEWPDEIPKPSGTPIEGEDGPDFYLVDGDRDFYEDYVDELLDVPGATLDYQDEDEHFSTSITIGDYWVFVMYHEDYEWVSVSIY